MFGRNGEAPVPVVAPRSPADCFDIALEAVRIAVTYRTPVFLLSDGYLANGSEPWRVPERRQLPDHRRRLRHRAERRQSRRQPQFRPYLRDPETLARPWAIPGTPGLEHRIGGIEKADRTGEISYDPDNHDTWCGPAQAKVDAIAASIPPLEVDDPPGDGAGAGAGLGLDVRADRRGVPAGAGRGVRSPRRTCGTSTRSRPTSARCCARTTGCWCRR